MNDKPRALILAATAMAALGVGGCKAPGGWDPVPTLEHGEIYRGAVYGGLEGTAHMGVDWRARIGTPIYAATGGTVTVAIDYGHGGDTCGREVTIEQAEPKLTTVYCHLKQVKVRYGEEVRRGQQIGTVGRSGTRTPHLHFHVTEGYLLVDPIPLIESGAIRHPLAAPGTELRP